MVSARWKSRVRRRKTLRDVGEIVLGVLIALGLGAVASEIGWELEVWQARRAIADELGEIVGQGKERERADQCIERKLDSVSAILDQAEATGRLPPTGSLGDPMFRTWSTGVWDATRSAQIASQMGREMQDDLSGVYRIVDIINRATDDELTAWTELHAIVGPGRAIEPDEISALRRALSRARVAHRQIAISGILVDRYTRQLELPVNRESVVQYAGADIAAECAPVPIYAGERYGSAPFAGSAARIRARGQP